MEETQWRRRNGAAGGAGAGGGGVCLRLGGAGDNLPGSGSSLGWTLLMDGLWTTWMRWADGRDPAGDVIIRKKTGWGSGEEEREEMLRMTLG